MRSVLLLAADEGEAKRPLPASRLPRASCRKQPWRLRPQCSETARVSRVGGCWGPSMLKTTTTNRREKMDLHGLPLRLLLPPIDAPRTVAFPAPVPPASKTMLVTRIVHRLLRSEVLRFPLPPIDLPARTPSSPSAAAAADTRALPLCFPCKCHGLETREFAGTRQRGESIQEEE